MILRNIMKNLQDKKFTVIRVSQNEFELDNGDVYPIPFNLDEIPTVEEFQTLLNNSKEMMLQLIKDNG